MTKSKESQCDLSDNIKRNNIQIIGVSEGKRGKGPESLFKEIMAESLPKLGRDLAVQVHEANGLPRYYNPKWSSHYNETIKNQRERILKAAREKKIVTYTETHISLSAGSLQARRE